MGLIYTGRSIVLYIFNQVIGILPAPNSVICDSTDQPHKIIYNLPKLSSNNTLYQLAYSQVLLQHLNIGDSTGQSHNLIFASYTLLKLSIYLQHNLVCCFSTLTADFKLNKGKVYDSAVELGYQQ
jgi:hypothetical protein